jgi:predicted transglutaminase-like cysteine proteinase
MTAMNPKNIVLGGVGFLVLVVSIHAATTAINHLTPSSPVLAPLAHTQFCIRYPNDCKNTDKKSATNPVALTPERRAELDEVNARVNQSIVAQDQHATPATEKWLVAPAFGDCNDYVVTKRHELLAKGWALHSLLMTEVALPSGEHHLLLIVRTSEGDLVLDNLKPTVRTVAEAEVDYKWVRMESDRNARFWNKVRESS